MKKLPFIFTALLGLSHSAYADLLGVQDAQLILIAWKQLKELQMQYRVLRDSYNNAQNQLDSMNQFKSMHSGNYGFGDFENNLDVLHNWQSPANTWAEALHNLSGGNPERYKALMEAYEKNHPALNEQEYAYYATPQQSKRFKEDKAVNRAVLVQTTESYNQINHHMASLYKLSKQIEKTRNTKGAIDLNSRLLTELAFIQLMQVRLQTLMNQQVAQEELSELQDRAEMAKFHHRKKSGV